MGAGALSTESVWRELQADLARFIGRRVSDAHLAEDLLQEVFVRIHTHLGSLGDAERLPAWVYRIARNVIHDHYRRPASATSPLAEDVPCEPEVGEDPRFGLTWLRSMVDRLPETYREAVRLSELEGLSHAEVAERLGVSLPAAKSRVQRGRAALKAMLHECCDFEIDRRGNVVDFQRRGRCLPGDPGAESRCDC